MLDYHPLYLGEVAAARPLFVRDMLRDLLADFEAGVLSPLPHRSYPDRTRRGCLPLHGSGPAHGQDRHHATPGPDAPR